MNTIIRPIPYINIPNSWSFNLTGRKTVNEAHHLLLGECRRKEICNARKISSPLETCC